MNARCPGAASPEIDDLPGQTLRVATTLPMFEFDGDCGFCRKWAAWTERRIPGQATFVPYQSIDIAALGHWIDEQGRIFRGNRSFAKALQRSRSPWRAVGIAGDLPGVRVLAGLFYRWVVRNRHRLPAPDLG